MDVHRYFDTSRRIHAAIFASGLLILILVVGTVFIESAARMEPTGYTIFDFQGAWTKQRSDQILLAWINILDIVLLQTYWDYLFILSNVLLSVGLLGFLGNILSSPLSRKLTFLGIAVSIIGGLFDSLENIWTILILSNSSSYPEIWIQLVSFFAQSKFILSYFKYGILICVLILVVLEKFKARTPQPVSK